MFRFFLSKTLRRTPNLPPLEIPPELCVDGRAPVGKMGEDIAAWYVEHIMRMTILGRNLELFVPELNRRRQGELDILAKDGGAMVFVEVRTRRYVSEEYGGPESTIGAKKRFHITRAARLWLHQNRVSPDIPVRFDIAAVVWNDGDPIIKYYIDAFPWEETKIR